MSTTSKEWHIATGQLSDKLYRVNSNTTSSGMVQVWLEVQHVPGASSWEKQEGTEADTTILISRLRELSNGSLFSSGRFATVHLWLYIGGRGNSVRTLARLTDSDTLYQTSTDEGASWRETDHPYALALRILELDPA